LCTQEEHDTACLRRFPFDEITLLKIGSPGAGEIRDGALAARRLFRARLPISMARKKSARLHQERSPIAHGLKICGVLHRASHDRGLARRDSERSSNSPSLCPSLFDPDQ